MLPSYRPGHLTIAPRAGRVSTASIRKSVISVQMYIRVASRLLRHESSRWPSIAPAIGATSPP